MKIVKDNKEKDVINFRNKKQTFLKWLENVKENNFETEKAADIDSCLIIWADKDENNKVKSKMAFYNMADIEDFDFFTSCLKDYMLERKFEDYLTHHIGDFLEFIND